MTDAETEEKRLYPHEIYIDPLRLPEKQWTNDPVDRFSEKYIRADLVPLEDFAATITQNNEMAQVLEDVNTLCDTGEFSPEIFLEFIADGKVREFMQYHRDYHQKTATKRQ